MRHSSSSTSTEHIDTIRVIDKVNALNSPKRYLIDVLIDGKILQIEVDTGAPCDIVSKNTLRKIKPKFTLKKSEKQFVSYTGHSIFRALVVFE